MRKQGDFSINRYKVVNVDPNTFKANVHSIQTIRIFTIWSKRKKKKGIGHMLKCYTHTPCLPFYWDGLSHNIGNKISLSFILLKSHLLIYFFFYLILITDQNMLDTIYIFTMLPCVMDTHCVTEWQVRKVTEENKSVRVRERESALKRAPLSAISVRLRQSESAFCGVCVCVFVREWYRERFWRACRFYKKYLVCSF